MVHGISDNSLHGVIFAISIDHGFVLHYVVKTLVCFEIKVTSTEWKEHHAPNFPINHKGSSVGGGGGGWRTMQQLKCLQYPLRNINYFMFLLVMVIPVLLGLLLK